MRYFVSVSVHIKPDCEVHLLFPKLLYNMDGYVKMNKKIALKTAIWSFGIAWAVLGCILIANQFGYLKYGTPFAMALAVIGASAPAIAAYVALVKGKVMPAKQFFKTVFAVKQPVLMYILTIVFAIVYFGTAILTGLADYSDTPIYLWLLDIPLMILVGGLEEVGWRFVLNPALEKKLPFAAASLIVGIVWTVWHLPIFFIEGAPQYYWNFGIFFIGTIGLSFAYAAIYRLSKSVWLCVLIHAINNSLPMSYNVDRFDTAVIPVTITAVVLIIVSTIAVFAYNKKLKRTVV